MTTFDNAVKLWGKVKIKGQNSSWDGNARNVNDCEGLNGTQTHTGVMYPNQRAIVDEVWLRENNMFPGIPFNLSNKKVGPQSAENKRKKCEYLVSQTKWWKFLEKLPLISG